MTRFRSPITRLIDQNQDITAKQCRDDLQSILLRIHRDQLLANHTFATLEEYRLLESLALSTVDDDDAWRKGRHISDEEVATLQKDPRLNILIEEIQILDGMLEAKSLEDLDGRLVEYESFITRDAKMDRGEFEFTVLSRLQKKFEKLRESVDAIKEEFDIRKGEEGYEEMSNVLRDALGSPGTDVAESPPPKEGRILPFDPNGRR